MHQPINQSALAPHNSQCYIILPSGSPRSRMLGHFFYYEYESTRYSVLPLYLVGSFYTIYYLLFYISIFFLDFFYLKNIRKKFAKKNERKKVFLAGK